MSQGWTWKPLGEVCKTSSGGTPLSSRKEFYEGGTIPWLVSGEVAQGNVREAKNFITAAGLENSAAKLFPRDTVLVAMYGATAGQVGILKFEAATNQAVCGILPNDKFVPEFLYYYLLAKKDDLVAQATGNAQPNISQLKIKNTAVPVLPLPEQQRIVALLDKAFVGLATAKSNAERNLQNSRAIFESHLQAVFSQWGEGWVEKRLNEVCVLINGRAYKKEEMLSAGKYPLLRVGNFFSNRDWYYSDLELDADKYCEKGDLLYAWSASFGPRIWEGDKVIYHYHIWKVLPKETVVEKRFLLYLMEWDVDQIKLAHGTGTTMMHVSKSSMESRVVPVPPLRLQSGIVSQLDGLRVETQHLTHLYERKLAALEELKKALLQQAFNGEI
jgi:type I restriction enzyme S subunit